MSHQKIDISPSGVQQTQHFWWWHLQLPLALLLLFSLAIEVFGVDRHLAQWLYQWEGGRWSLRNAWLTNAFLHSGGKHLSLAVALLCLGGFVASFFNARLAAFKRPLGYLVLCAVSASLLVSLVKQNLAVSCPWEFDLFGGKLAYVSVWQQLWLRTGEGCFPAAHASAGYAWVCAYFAARSLGVSWAKWLLVGALAFGFLFGFGQQLRGAHFISHDLWTLAICWFTALVGYRFLLMPKASRAIFSEGVEQV